MARGDAVAAEKLAPEDSLGSSTLGALYFIFVLTGVVTALLGPILPLLQLRFAVNDQQAGLLFVLNADETGPHTPGMSPACARFLAEETPIAGIGVETVGTDAGAAHSFDPPFPCHAFLLGAGKYGLTQLANLAQLPPTGIVLVVAPLPSTGGSGSPARVLALVES